MLPVLLLVTAFIVYGSLYPWQFHAAATAGNPLLILLGSRTLEFNRYFAKDAAVNIVLYIPFGTACYLWLSTRALWIKILAPLALALLLSSSLEMIQIFDARRVCSMIDVVTNFMGTALGIALATRFRSMVTLRPGTGVPLFLLACWTAAMLFPFMPDLSLVHLNYKLLAITNAHFSPVPFFSLLVMWLVAARALEAAVDRYVVPLLLLVLPLRFLVVGLTLTWTETLAAILAVMIFFSWPYYLWRDQILAGLSIAAIILTGLSPFHFSPTTQHFSWIPFRALFVTDWQAGVAIFFRKCFNYASTIWLLTLAGVSLFRAAWEIALMLTWLEVNQLWLPNHVAESSDPLHAILLAWLIQRLTPTQSSPPNPR